MYARIQQRAINCIFVSSTSQPHLEELLAKLPKATAGPKTPTLDKIAQRQLNRSAGQPHPLHNRVRYFDPSKSLETELKGHMQKESLREATMDEIKEENLLRHLMATLLVDRLQDPALKAFVQQALHVPRALITT